MFGGTLEMKSGLFVCVVVLVLIEPTTTITTTHHDKAPHRSSRRPADPPSINLTLPFPERQKRLLPYYNFYLAQDINRPVAVRHYKTPPKPQRPRPAENFTPFLESNALPGPFIPIVPKHQQYDVEERVPNYSDIYDKLSQLKLQQDAPRQELYRVVADGRPRDNAVHQGKTVVQTYTPTEVELSANDPLEEVYVSTVRPGVKPPYQHQIYITTTRPEIEQEVYLSTAKPRIQPKPYLYNVVNQDHIQPVTLEEIAQYETDKKQFTDAKKPLTVYDQPEQIQRPILYLPDTVEHPERSSLDTLLKKLQATNTLPRTLTADNIDNSIKTLVRILSGLKKQQKFSRPIVVADEEDYAEEVENQTAGDGGGSVEESVQMYPLDTAEGGTPGRPGVDYPALSSIPQTSFNCKTQRYKGFFGDPDTNCQVWHYCDLNGGQSSFLCPNGTIFSQVALTCDWWFNVKCSTTAQLYVLNERLYKYILPLAPKFPEDYSGPLVDKYLALKFQEMEEKMQKQKKGKERPQAEEKDGEEEATTVDPNYVTKLEDARK